MYDRLAHGERDVRIPMTDPTRSFWLDGAPYQDYRSAPDLPARADVVVVGGGISGYRGCMLLHMRRTQLLLTADLHRRASAAARARRMSLGKLVREALSEYLARSGDTGTSCETLTSPALAIEAPGPRKPFSTNVTPTPARAR